MSSTATPLAADGITPAQRLQVLFDELAELTGHRNAIHGRIVDIIAEIDRDGLAGFTGARSLESMVAWKTGVSPTNAKTLTTIARRLDEFPRCTTALREGRVSLDQMGVIATHAGTGSDDHYIQLIDVATVTQLRTATKLEPPTTTGARAGTRQRPRTRAAACAATRTATLPHHDLG